MPRQQDFFVGANPVHEIANAAQQYAHQQGFHLPEANYGHVVMPESSSREIGRAYDRMPDFDRQALPAYKQMAEETGRQFDFMTRPRSKGGLGIDVEVTHHEPYGADNIDNAIGEFRDDVVHNHRMKVLSTASTGGHPVFTNDQNDQFRAVHDVFGHLAAGRGIDFDGEEAAYQKHSRMFSPLARRAMATETRGQNSALRLHGDFQDQKVGFLPDHMQSLQFTNAASPADRLQAVARAQAKHAAQFGL